MEGHGLGQWPEAGVKRGVWAHPRSVFASLCLPPFPMVLSHEPIDFQFRLSLIQDVPFPFATPESWITSVLSFPIFSRL